MVRCPGFCPRSPKPNPKIESIRATTACWSRCPLIRASYGHRPLLNSRGLCSTSAKQYRQLGAATSTTRNPERDARLGQKGQATIYGP